jgi:hypothetical protein
MHDIVSKCKSATVFSSLFVDRQTGTTPRNAGGLRGSRGMGACQRGRWRASLSQGDQIRRQGEDETITCDHLIRSERFCASVDPHRVPFGPDLEREDVREALQRSVEGVAPLGVSRHCDST